MKVFAEYFERDNLTFRKNTILQFGESWNLIGNIVLANPGSSKPITEVSLDFLLKIQDFYSIYRPNVTFNENNWLEFNVDPTMGFIEKIFAGKYVGENIELNGVVQLFNTFNIKNQNLQEAVNQIGIESDLLFSFGIQDYFHDKPTYFGFGSSVLNNNILCEVARDIFNSSSSKIKKIYKSEFIENSFYHPMYVNRAYGQSHFESYKKNVLVRLIEGA